MSAITYIYPPIEVSATDLYDGFVTYMQSQIPNWQPYSGALDDWIARGFTAIAAQLGEITSDVATQIYRYFGANLINLPPNDATSATGLITITVQDTAGYTVPAYTQMTFQDPTGTAQGFETIVDTVIAPGASTATAVSVQAITPGAAGNGCSGTGSITSTESFVTGLVLTSTTAGGTDAEDDLTYLNRLTTELTTLSPTPITPSDFTIIAQSQPGVGRALTLPTFNPANGTMTGNTHTSTTVDTLSNVSAVVQGTSVSGSGIPGGAYVKSVNVGGSSIVISAAATATASGVTLTFGGLQNQGGYVTSWIADSTGTPLSSPAMAVVQAAIQAMCLTNVIYSVKAPTVTPVNIVATAYAYPGFDTVAAQAAVVAALNTALAPGQWGNGLPSGEPSGGGWANNNTVRLVFIEYVIMSAAGIHYVDSSTVTINGVAADLGLAGVVPLTSAGTMTITVNTG